MTAEETVALAQARLRASNGALSAIRQRAKLSQEAIGRAVGVSRVTVLRWENGERAPSGAPAVQLAKLLRQLEAMESRAARPQRQKEAPMAD